MNKCHRRGGLGRVIIVQGSVADSLDGSFVMSEQKAAVEVESTVRP